MKKLIEYLKEVLIVTIGLLIFLIILWGILRLTSFDIFYKGNNIFEFLHTFFSYEEKAFMFIFIVFLTPLILRGK